MVRLIQSCSIHRNVENLSFEELWDVEDDGKDNNRDDILGNSIVDTGGSYSISVVERVADSTVSEDHENDDEDDYKNTHLSKAMATVSPIEQHIVILFRG